MSNTIRVAGGQIDVAIGDVRKNLARIEDVVAESTRNGARLTVFPECALSGYCFENLAEAQIVAEPADGPSVAQLTAMCRRTESYLCTGMLEQDGARTFNACVLVGPQGLMATYRKVHLPGLGVDWFVTPGDRPFEVWNVEGIRIGAQICYDGSFPEPARVMALLGADLIVWPTNWPPAADCQARYLVNARAMENNVYAISVNRVGEERGFRFIGHSRACDPRGNTLAEAAHENETILYADIDPEFARQKHLVRIPGKHEINRLADRRPEFYGPLAQKSSGRV